jgi:deoxyhypusine synthase
MVDVIVTTAGGIEEDFIKCMGHTYMGDFALKGGLHIQSQSSSMLQLVRDACNVH